MNIPEGSENGKDPVKLMLEMLMQMMGPDVFSSPPELERAHWTLTSRPSRKLSYQGTVIRIYPDLSATLAKKWAAFNGIKQALYQNNVKFHLLYLAQLQVMYRGDVHTFNSPEEAQRFYPQTIAKK